MTQLEDHLEHIKTLVRELSEPYSDRRLILYMIRETAWSAMMEIDHESYENYIRRQQRKPSDEEVIQSFGVDDL